MASGSVCRNYLVTVTCAFTSLYFLRQQPLLSRTLAVEGGLLDCGSCAAEARERAVPYGLFLAVLDDPGRPLSWSRAQAGWALLRVLDRDAPPAPESLDLRTHPRARDAARLSVAEALGLDNGANVADVDEALTVATASDVSQFLGDAAACSAALPVDQRTATLALALSRVAWHHVAYSAPNVYGLLSVELLANGLVSERWLRRVAPCAEINHRFGWS
ncbi:hypothetical protein JL721_6601 [Aureococcus anophagefferens]|nr:hypothetical protein JL721_6601 [Aureococcus anophagefferens]